MVSVVLLFINLAMAFAPEAPIQFRSRLVKSTLHGVEYLPGQGKVCPISIILLQKG